MSTTFISQGFIATLKNHIEEDVLEDMMETVSANNSTLEINYEGTLLVSDRNRVKSYSQREFCGDLFIIGSIDAADKEVFITQAKEAGYEIDLNTIQPYICVWYNGSDSPVSMLTKEKFLGK